jgi:hypothetical protein
MERGLGEATLLMVKAYTRRQVGVATVVVVVAEEEVVMEGSTDSSHATYRAKSVSEMPSGPMRTLKRAQKRMKLL